jgi:hypothetical protein
MVKKAIKKEVSIEIDKLTNSIVNIVSGEIFETEFSKVLKKEIKNKDWLFDWNLEMKDRENEVYKMTTVENRNIIQGLVSLKKKENYVFVNLVENAKFNRGKDKMYIGVGGNLFAFACKLSKDSGFDGYVAFDAKTALVNYYYTTLGAERALGQRMYISDENAAVLMNQYFKTK